MKTFIQIHLIESKHHTNLMMRKHLFICTLVLTCFLASCRSSSTPNSATTSSKVEPEKVFKPESDTVLVQQTLESVAEGGTFRFESAVPQSFSQILLNEMMNIIHTKHNKNRLILEKQHNRLEYEKSSHYGYLYGKYFRNKKSLPEEDLRTLNNKFIQRKQAWHKKCRGLYFCYGKQVQL